MATLTTRRLQLRLATTGALRTFKAMCESLRNPESFSHERFFQWKPEEIKTYMKDLLNKMGPKEKRIARELMNLSKFDFTIVLEFHTVVRAISVPTFPHGVQFSNRMFSGSRMLNNGLVDDACA